MALRLSEGLGVAARSAKEATVLVTVDHMEKCLQRMNLRHWFIAVPLEILPHPVDLPAILRADEGCLRDRRVHRLGVVLPVGANLEQFDALAFELVAQIQLRTDFWRRPTALHELCYVPLVALSLQITECHVVSPILAFADDSLPEVGSRAVTADAPRLSRVRGCSMHGAKAPLALLEREVFFVCDA